MYKFKVGDSVVIIKDKTEADITGRYVSMDGAAHYSMITKDVKPRYLSLLESEIAVNYKKYTQPAFAFSKSYQSPTLNVDNVTHCPKCGDKWKETEHLIFGRNKIWKDCIKCNKRREDLV